MIFSNVLYSIFSPFQVFPPCIVGHRSSGCFIDFLGLTLRVTLFYNVLKSSPCYHMSHTHLSCHVLVGALQCVVILAFIPCLFISAELYGATQLIGNCTSYAIQLRCNVSLVMQLDSATRILTFILPVNIE